MPEYNFTQYWNEDLVKFGKEHTDVYFTEDYIKLYESDKSVAECFVYSDHEKKFLFPYLKTEVPWSDAKLYDIESQYGYGGPLANTEDLAFLADAQTCLHKTFIEKGIIGGFVRFHPLLQNESLLAKIFRIEFNRKTVAIDLTKDEATIKNEFSSMNQRAIRKAYKSGLQVIIDPLFEHFESFKQIYVNTMRRVNAHDFYFFDDVYFEELKKNKNAYLSLIKKENVFIAAAVFFKNGFYAHYHLGGSLAEFQSDKPNNLLFFENAIYLKKNDCRILHLGGGTDSSEENSLLQFKRGFSKHEFHFYIGKAVFNRLEYDRVCRAWHLEDPEKHLLDSPNLLKYRT